MSSYEIRVKFDTKSPQWMQTVLVQEDGRAFVAAGAFGMSDMEAFLCAGHDGTPMIEHRKHVFLELDWFLKEYAEPRGNARKVKLLELAKALKSYVDRFDKTKSRADGGWTVHPAGT